MRIILIVLMFTTYLTASDILTDKEYKYIDYALKCMKMTRKDMGFYKEVRKSPYILPIVKKCLNNPLKTTTYTDKLAKEFSKSHRLYDILRICSKQLVNKDIEINKLKDKSLYNLLKSITTLSDDKINKQMKNLPVIIRKVLSHLILAVIRATEYKNNAFKKLTKAERRDILKKLMSDEVYKYTEKVNYEKLYRGGLIIANAIDYAIEKLSNISNLNSVKGLLFDVKTRYGRIIVGGSDSQVYTGNVAIIIDLGGDDIYKASAYKQMNIWIDAGGNDVYRAKDDFSIGSAVLGFGYLVDLEGNDIYEGAEYTQGAGLFGIGFLYDKDGQDKYFADGFAQAASMFGIGVLIDEDGYDTYNSNIYSQAFARVQAISVLIDRKGHDRYYVGGKYSDSKGRWSDRFHINMSQGCAYGDRSTDRKKGAGGGIALLLDEGGNDTYSGELFVQGVSYWYGLGMLVDNSGNDVYTSHQYAQGSGIHLSVGCLIDRGGSDKYSSLACCQGQGHDMSVGILIDENGNDYYTAKDLSQGGASANSVGILIDKRGDDAYMSRVVNRGQPYGNPRRGFGGIGVLMDFDGNDTYSGYLMNDYVYTGSKWACGVDLKGENAYNLKKLFDWNYKNRKVKKGKEKKHNLLPKHLNRYEILNLWRIASQWNTQPTVLKQRKKAKAQLIAEGKNAAKVLIDIINKLTRFNYRDMQEILREIGKPAVSYLIKKLKSPDFEYRYFAATFLRYIKDRRSIKPLINAIKNEKKENLHRYIIVAKNTQEYLAILIEALGRQKASEAVDIIIGFLDNESHEVQRHSALALGNIKDKKAIKPLIEKINPNCLIDVRMPVVDALVSFGDDIEPYMISLVKGSDYFKKIYAIEILGRIKSKKSLPYFRDILKNSNNSFIKGFVIDALANFGINILKQQIKNINFADSSLFVKSKIKYYLNRRQ